MPSLSELATDERTARMVLSMLVDPNDPVTAASWPAPELSRCSGSPGASVTADAALGSGADVAAPSAR